MIYLTGDTHGDFRRLSNKNQKKNEIHIGMEDYVIICGDMGLCWAKDKEFEWNCKWFAQTKFTTLFVPGNHDNYDMIAEYPLEEWHGGKVRHIVKDKVILLERGQIVDIDGYTFFTFGGGQTHDIEGGLFRKEDPDFKEKAYKARKKGLPYRIIGESWWEQELPSEEEMQEGLSNLAKVNYKVDYLITHCCASTMQAAIDHVIRRGCKPDRLTEYFEALEGKLTYKHWYFGHYHLNEKIDEKHTVLYHEIIQLQN